MATIKNKLVFNTKDKDENDLELCVKKPNTQQSKELQKVYNRSFKEALDSGAILRVKVEQVAREQNIWNDTIQKEFEKLQTQISDLELKLAKGGNAGLTLKKAKDVAIELAGKRNQLRMLLAPRNEIDVNTAEAQAENARFNYMVALCTYFNSGKNEGKNYFKDYDDFVEKLSEKASMDAAKYLGFLIYNLEPDYEMNLPENKFLVDYGFANKDGKLINKDGKFVNLDGHPVDEKGRLINEKNELVDKDGNLLDDKGNYKVDFKPFLPEDDE